MSEQSQEIAKYKSDEELDREVEELQDAIDLTGIQLSNKGNITPEMKAAAVVIYHVYGSSIPVGQKLGIAASTVRAWKRQEWWDQIDAQVRKRRGKELDVKMTNILHNAMEEIEDRLVNGDEVVDFRTGEKQRKKVGAKELATLAAIIYDKRELGRGGVTSRSESVVRDEHLNKIQDQFKKFAQANEIEAERVNDVEDAEAVYEPVTHEQSEDEG